jgi:hypothetical protein
MTTKQIFLLLYSFSILQTRAQPVIDGVINSSEGYITVATFTSGRSGFGSENSLGAIYYRYQTKYTPGEIGTIFLGITGNVTDANNIVVFMDFDSYQGRSTQSLRGNNTSCGMGVFNTTNSSIQCGVNGGIRGMVMDDGFDADYAFAFNKGSTTDRMYCDAMRFSAQNNADGFLEWGNIGFCDQSGGSYTVAQLPFDENCTSSPCAGPMEYAFTSGYNTGSNSNRGIEMRIPYASLPGIAPGDNVRFFIIITNQSGYLSNVTIPGDPGNNNLECSANLSTISGQTFFTSFYLLPFAFQSLTAQAEKNDVSLHWKVSGNNLQKEYQVEKSINGRNFETIAVVTASGEDVRTFKAIDAYPKAGWNYYRVAAVNAQQQKRYSEIVRVFWGTANTVIIAPNPVNGRTIQLYSDGLPKGNYRLIITAADGKQVYSCAWMHDGLSPVYSISSPVPLPAGMYWMLLQNDNHPPVRLRFIQQ